MQLTCAERLTLVSFTDECSLLLYAINVCRALNARLFHTINVCRALSSPTHQRKSNIVNVWFCGCASHSYLPPLHRYLLHTVMFRFLYLTNLPIDADHNAENVRVLRLGHIGRAALQVQAHALWTEIHKKSNLLSTKRNTRYQKETYAQWKK